MSVTDAASHLGVTRVTLSRVLNGAAGISAEMGLRLSEALGTSPELWIGMQAQCDLSASLAATPQEFGADVCADDEIGRIVISSNQAMGKAFQ
jgi:addiction module HigA family antidote